ncbi:probable malonyl-CoA-acyl carrier protein transacylase, mitochondrial [Trichogramma pretiosum]|uniref:probable malonyl-CoA-acyl carrier protein transacylase, mitochondrial n=1 Tax=Trichogramma pretiosum TaxID=7493 RepID=UPI0006C96BD8|nr:probable malonyl-CoA-acyl carrier protein transacylase, mitochondrial [Trichogramma pretiosum]
MLSKVNYTTMRCCFSSMRLYLDCSRYNCIVVHSKIQKRKYSDSSKEPSVSKLLEEAASFNTSDSSEWSTSPYPVTADHDKPKPKKNIIDPTDTSIILFPGQGVINVGDAKKYLRFPRVKDLYEIASSVLGYDLLKLSLKGPQNLLDRTEFNQPATVVLSLAALEKLQEERPKAFESCVATAGYSVGELTALIFSGALTYEEGLKLVKARAVAMQSATEMSNQGMLSCICTPSANVSLICKEAEKWAMDIGASEPICRVAIYLYTQMKVIGGCNEALQYIEKNSRNLGLRKVSRLPVSGAFHTSLMEPALKSFVKALNNAPLSSPNTTVYSNFSGKVFSTNPSQMKKQIIKQIISPVKWEQIMQTMYSRPPGTEFPRTFDVGSKGMLKTILKNINAKAIDECHVY